VSVGSQLAAIERLTRVAAKAERRRALQLVRPTDPGPLLDCVPRWSANLRRPEHLTPLADAFERAVRGERVRVAFSVPVRFGKTSLLQHAIPWLLRKDPTRSILYLSYAHGFARKQTARALTIAHRAGVGLGGSRRKDEWQTLAGGQVKAAGIGGQITGEGFTDIIIDDPHKNRAEAESRLIREGVLEALDNDVFTREDPRGTSIYLVHARWHVNDAIGVYSRAEHGRFDYTNLPALDRSGKSLAPWLWSEAFLKEKELSVGPYVWASLYQGQPQPRGGALFVDVSLVIELRKGGPLREAIGFDLAHTAKTRSDHHAAVHMRRHMDQKPGVYDVPEAIAMRGTLGDRRRSRDGEVVDRGFIQAIVPMIRRNPAAALVMYAWEREEGVIRSFEAQLSAALGQRVRIHILDIEGRDKWIRSSEGYAPAWNDGRVLIPSPKSRDGWQNGFVAQHVAFSGLHGEENDLVDAGTAAFDFLVRIGSGGGKPRTTGEGSEADRMSRYV